MDENGMKFDEGEVDELTRALFHDATVVTSNSGNSGGITFDALKAQLTKHDGLLQNLSISIDRWLVPPKPKKPATFMESMVAKVSRLTRNQEILFDLILSFPYRFPTSFQCLICETTSSSFLLPSSSFWSI